MKKWWKSKTLWFNAIMGALVALEASLGQLSTILPANWYIVISIVLPVGNAILRVASTTELTK